MFKNVNLDELWYEGEASKEYECGPLDDEKIKETEEQLGFKLPESYKYLMKKHNGGLLQKNYLAIKNTDGFNDLDGIYGIGEGYKSINYMNSDRADFEENLLYICDSNSGHTNIYLDYSECGPQGEPSVVGFDNESLFYEEKEKPFYLAKNFEDFISRLCFEEDEEEINKHDTIKYFVPDDKTHKVVKKYVLLYNQIGMYITIVTLTTLIVVGFSTNISLLKYILVPIILIPLDFFLIIGSIILIKDVTSKKYKCWYDVIDNITTENGNKTYVLKETDGKMDFIVRKKDKLEIGDKVLCMSEGYTFKYNQEGGK